MSPLRIPQRPIGNLRGPPNPTRRNLADCLVVADDRLAAREATTNRSITYKELSAKAGDLAVKIKTVFTANLDSINQPICLHMHRSIDWYIAYMACAKAGIPVVGASKDLADKAVENRRLEDIFSLLNPIGVIVDHSDDLSLFDKFVGVPVYVIADLTQDNPLAENPTEILIHDPQTLVDREQSRERHADISEQKGDKSVLAYHFTGGTTAASKCVIVTHEMAIHEIDSYPSILPSFVRRPETVLQNSSMYWPASAFGQLDIAIAFQACAILSVIGGSSSEEVSTLVERERVDCIGVVPSVLRALNPETCCACLSLVFTWGEALPRSVAAEWCNRVDLVDLLIATEYWLSFFSVITLPSQIGTFQVAPNTRIHLEQSEQDGRGAVLWVSGPMVTPGYVGNAARDRFKTINGDEYFRTNDCVKLEKDFLTYLGRSDDLQKVGGTYVDLVAASNEIIERLDRLVADCVLVRDQWNQVHAILALNQPAPVHTLVTACQKCIGSILPKHVHILAEMPRNVATGKVDFKALNRMVSDESLASPQYTIPDSEVPAGKLLSLPNPHRYMWLLLLVSVLSINWELILKGIVEIVVSSVDHVPIWSLLRLPFLTHGLHALIRVVPGLKSLLNEFPGGIPFIAISLLVVCGKDECLFSPVVRLLTLIGDVCVVRPEMPIHDAVTTSVWLASAALAIAVVLCERGLSCSLLVVIVVPLVERLSRSPLIGLGLIALAEMALKDVTGWNHVWTGVLILGFASLEGIKSLASFWLIFYVTAPHDLAWAWTSWWKDVPSLMSVLLYYGRNIEKKISAFSGQRVKFNWVRKSYVFLTTCWDTHTESGYTRRKRHPASVSEYRRQYSCDNCGKWVIESEGAYDKYSKFSSGGSNWWVCENCWWSDVVDTKKGYKSPRIGMWTNNWISGKLRRTMFPSVPITPSLDETSDDDEKSTRHPSISGIEDIESSLVVPSQHSVTAKVCLEALQSVGVDTQILPGISSLQRVAVHEQLKKRMPAVSSVSAMKLFKDVDNFSDLVETIVKLYDEDQPSPKAETGDGAGLYKVPFAGSHLWEHGACDWLLSFKCEEGEDALTNPEETFTNAFHQLVRIHPALRARPLDDISFGNSLLQAIALSPRWLKGLVLPACLQLWPRVAVAPFNPEDPIPISFEYMENGFSQKSVLARASRYRNESGFKPPFDVVVYLPAAGTRITTAFIYVRVTHLFSDGLCVNAIASDLDGLLKKELEAASETVNAFKCLEYRVTRSLLTGASSPEDRINLCSQSEEIYREKSLVEVLWLQHTTVKSLVELSGHLGVPMEAVMIGLVMGSLATKLGWAKMPVHLMHAQRDGLDEARMIGYFSDYKDLGFLNTGTSYMDLFHQLSTKIRSREWRFHSNETLYDHSVGRHAWDESVFPVSFNVLPRFRKSRDGLIDNIETYWRAGPRFGQKDCRLIHVYMEETRLGQEWAVRLHASKRFFDCAWIVDYVCRVFDNAIKSVLSDPSKPIPVS